MAFDLSSLLPIGGNILDSIIGNNRYNDQSNMTEQQLAFQRELINKSSDWQSGNNQDIIDYILGNNPLNEADQAAQNEGQFDWADYINSLRSGYANDVNDELSTNSGNAIDTAGGNYNDQGKIAGGQQGISDDLLSIANGRDPSQYASIAEGMAGQLNDNPYNLDEMQADAQQLATMGVDREYNKLMDDTSRDSVRAGTDASTSLLQLGSQAARDQVEATLKARLAVPQAYEATVGARQGRLGGAINTLEGAAGGIDSRAIAGSSAASNALNSASGALNTGAGLDISTLLHKNDYEDPSQGMVNAYDKYKSPLSLRANPYAATTNPYSSAKPAITPYPKVQEPNVGDTVSYGLQQLLQQFGR